MWLARRGHVANSDSAGSSSCSARLQSTHAQSRASPAAMALQLGLRPALPCAHELCLAHAGAARLRYACADTASCRYARECGSRPCAPSFDLPRQSSARGRWRPAGSSLPARCGVPSQPGRSRAARPRREHRPLDWKAGVPPQQVHAANANDELVEPVALGDLVPRAHPGGLGAARRRAHQDVPLSDEGAPARAAELRAFTTGG